MRRTLFILLGIVLLCSCKGNLVDDERTFDNNIWNKFTPEEFDVNVTNIEDYYNIDVTAAIDTAVYRYNTLPMLIKLDSPNGELRSFYAELPFVENGRPRGEMHDGYRVADRRLRAFFSFNSIGTHHMTVSQTTSQYDLEGIHSIHVTISKADLKYEF